MRKRWLAAMGTVAGACVLVAVSAVLASGGFAAPSVKAVAPENTSLPTIKGEPEEGKILNSDPGQWSGGSLEFARQWRRCNAAGTGCRNIARATDELYTVRPADVGRTLRVVVTAVNSDGAASAVSRPTAVVRPAPAQAPRNTVLPSITGKTEEGEVATAQAGTWLGTKPIDFSYRWRRCDEKGGDCVATSVTSQSYRLAQADVGHTLRVLVTASNSVGSSAAISNPSAVVKGKGAPTAGQCLAITSVSLPERLIVDRIQFDPSRIQSRGEPLTARFHVVTTKGACVRGAVVYAVGVPFNRLSKEAEVATEADGWATITFGILPTFQLRSGNFVVVFVRARKPGDNVLAGVSTRRLVSVRVA